MTERFRKVYDALCEAFFEGTLEKFRQEAEVKYPDDDMSDIASYKRVGWVQAREFSAAELEEKSRQIEQLREALVGLVKDVRGKPKDKRYETHLKIAETALENTKNK